MSVDFSGVTRALEEVTYAHGNVEFYRALYDSNGIEPSEVKTLKDFENLPFTYKADYRRNFPKRTLAEGFSPKHPMITSSRSSGSAGERLVTLEIGLHLLSRALKCSEINPAVHAEFHRAGRKIARFAAPNCSDVECANPNSQMEDRLLSDKTLVLPVYHDLLTTSDDMVSQAIAEVFSYEPDLFYVDPTHFAFLLRGFKQRELVPPEIPVLLSYSCVTNCSRRQINEYFLDGNISAQLLSSTEFGWLGMECPHGHLHLNDESFYVEYLDLEEESVIGGEEFKELCVTSIDQGASPHIRYRTGDIVTLVDGVCACGSQRQRVNMEGKLGYFLRAKGEPIISQRQVDTMMGAPDWLDLYQLEQVSDGDLLLKMVVNENYKNDAERYFIDSLTDRMGSDITVNCSVVDYIATERSGKFQAVKGLQVEE